MARIYSKVSMELWGDGKFLALSPLKPSAQALWLYLLTGRFRTSIPGVSLNVGLGALSDRLAWPPPTVEKHWREIEQQEMAAADWRAGLIWMPKGIEHNEPESPNVIKGWGKVVLPECALMTEALHQLHAYLSSHLSQAYVKAFQETFPKVSRNQEQEQEQEHEEPPNPPAVRGALASSTKPITRKERARAEEILRNTRGECPHVAEGDAPCVSQPACLGRIVERLREHERAGMQAERLS